MTGTDWAYLPSAPPGRTLLAEIIAAPAPDERTDALVELGRLVQTLDDRGCFAATADNVIRSSEGLALARPLVDEVEPLDRAASCARVSWHLAWSLLQAGALGPDAPDLSVDEHAVFVGGRAAIPITREDVERFRHHEATAHAAQQGFDRDVLERDMRAMGALTARQVAASTLLDPRAFARALTTSYDELVAARRDRDTAEAAAVDHVASRALAQSLGEVLERDEWIRARLRTVKATKPARALIEARKRFLGRGE